MRVYETGRTEIYFHTKTIISQQTLISACCWSGFFVRPIAKLLLAKRLQETGCKPWNTETPLIPWRIHILAYLCWISWTTSVVLMNFAIKLKATTLTTMQCESLNMFKSSHLTLAYNLNSRSTHYPFLELCFNSIPWSSSPLMSTLRCGWKVDC